MKQLKIGEAIINLPPNSSIQIVNGVINIQVKPPISFKGGQRGNKQFKLNQAMSEEWMIKNANTR